MRCRVNRIRQRHVQFATFRGRSWIWFGSHALTVTISQVTGLPFGLEFTPNNPDGVYQPGDGEYYGCSVVCGTPLVSGSFFVDISVTVLVSAFGFQQTVQESFSLPLVVEPGAGGGDPTSFALSTTQGCTPLSIQGTNLITDQGATYNWDFGNGATGAFNPRSPTMLGNVYGFGVHSGH